MAPFAVEGSTTCPRWVITILPAATRRRAAARAGSIKPSQSRRLASPPTAFAASEGHIVLSRPRSVNNSRIAASNSASDSPGLCPLHSSLQYLITSQSRSHFLRHSNERPQVLQIFSLCGVVRSGLRLRSGIKEKMQEASESSTRSDANLRKILQKQWRIFRHPKSDCQNTTSATQITTTSPQKTATKRTKISKTLCKRQLRYPAIFFPQNRTNLGETCTYP
jgi:hypothetical protein